MSNRPVNRHPVLVAFVVLSCAVVGYFTGLQSPVKSVDDEEPAASTALSDQAALPASVLPATGYLDMSAATAGRAERLGAAGAAVTMPQTNVDPLATFTIAAGAKDAALQAREQNRAFNGAPPTIPHPVDQRSDRSCLTCHGKGLKTDSLRISRMSHQFLANCTQCHVAAAPAHLAATPLSVSDFVGLPAPDAGPRAFAGAPPMMPHSTWMRRDCLSCHGTVGLDGLRTTHPWRRSCQQCHAPAAQFEQTQPAHETRFLPGPDVD